MENKEDKKELEDIMNEITGVAKDLVDEYVSGKDEFVPKKERAKMNEKPIKAPYKDEELDSPFKVTDEEMEKLLKVEGEIKDIIIENPDIYVQGEKDRIDLFKYARKVGGETFSILEYIGTDKDKLRLCLKIKTKTE